jgi:hypothetical protein
MTVANVHHSDLKAAHRRFLSLLALYADFKHGDRIFPGYDTLAAALQVTKESVRLYARHCEDLGLLEVVKEPKGKGVATEWKFCLENPAFPDSYTGFKPSLGPRGGLDQEKRLGPKASNDRSKSKAAKSSLGPRVGLDPPKPLHQHTTPTPSEERVCVDENTPAMCEQEVGALLEEFVKQNYGETVGIFTGPQRAALARLAKKHGREVFRAAARTWMKKSPWNNKTTHPFAAFISGFESYAAMSKHKTKAPLTQEEIDATNELARQRRVEMFGTVKPADNEPDANEFIDSEAVVADGSDEGDSK